MVGSSVLEGIANLVAKSLLMLDASAPSGRWRLLETVRAYALEKLAESNESEQAARRHGTGTPSARSVNFLARQQLLHNAWT
jgi:predicted ATPase